MATGQTRYGAGDLLAVPALRKDGSRISVEFSIIPFRDAAGRILGLGAVMRPNRSQTLQEAIEITCDFKRHYTEQDIVERAGAVLEMAIREGTLVVRGFADVGTVGGLMPVRGLLATRARYRGLVTMEIVAFPQEGLVRDPGADPLLREAMALGADVVGGLPWYELTDEDARRHIDIVFAIARERDAASHRPLRPGPRSATVRASGGTPGGRARSSPARRR